VVLGGPESGIPDDEGTTLRPGPRGNGALRNALGRRGFRTERSKSRGLLRGARAVAAAMAVACASSALGSVSEKVRIDETGSSIGVECLALGTCCDVTTNRSFPCSTSELLPGKMVWEIGIEPTTLGCFGVSDRSWCDPPQMSDAPGHNDRTRRGDFVEVHDVRSCALFGTLISRESNPRCAPKDSNLHVVRFERTASAVGLDARTRIFKEACGRISPIRVRTPVRAHVLTRSPALRVIGGP
jgi:hypothetical protein